MNAMETIRLATWINAPVERCFRLSLSIDLHMDAARSTHETAVAGVTSGLIGEGETVTFQTRHLGLHHSHTSRIEILRPYTYIFEVMVAGSFRHFEHHHHFAPMDDGTRVRQEIRFSARWGLAGQVAAKKRLMKVWNEHNAFLKQVAESDRWHQYLDERQGVTTTVSIKSQAPGDWDKNRLLRSSPR
jgi:ligand-binding SRPBCC domain-containing protein